jgi:NDP-sugar pyrophosphorylase family protein
MPDDGHYVCGSGLVTDSREGPPLDQRCHGTTGSVLPLGRKKEGEIFGQNLVVTEGFVVMKEDAVIAKSAETDGGDQNHEQTICDPAYVLVQGEP